jgi:hypothetical protein
VDGLNPTKRNILRQIALNGDSAEEIAASCDRQPKTVQNEITAICKEYADFMADIGQRITVEKPRLAAHFQTLFLRFEETPEPAVEKGHRR